MLFTGLLRRIDGDITKMITQFFNTVIKFTDFGQYLSTYGQPTLVDFLIFTL